MSKPVKTISLMARKFAKQAKPIDIFAWFFAALLLILIISNLPGAIQQEHNEYNERIMNQELHDMGYPHG